MIVDSFTLNIVFLTSQEFLVKLVNDNNNFQNHAKLEKEPCLVKFFNQTYFLPKNKVR